MTSYFDWHGEPGYWNDVAHHFDPDEPVLDVGCGSGWLGGHFTRYTGIEITSSGALAARRAGRGVIRGDAGVGLPVASNCFSQVICKDVLEHVIDPVLAVSELARVTRTGGRVYACSPDSQRWVWTDYTHRRPFPLGALRRLFGDHGFEVIESGYETVMPGVGVVSGWTDSHRRPLPFRLAGRVPIIPRNTWVLARRTP